LIQLSMFRDPALSARLAMSALVSTVMMATLVVRPFYLSGALGLDAAMLGLVVSVGAIVATLPHRPLGGGLPCLNQRADLVFVARHAELIEVTTDARAQRYESSHIRCSARPRFWSQQKVRGQFSGS
jgi:hypothetical protein